MSSHWWRGATLYQIYPRSDADAHGDGVGDLAGVTARQPYVAGLGVDGIWLSPFFMSPMRDFGYEVADHLGIDPLFGSHDDFDTLLAEALAFFERLRALMDRCGAGGMSGMSGIGRMAVAEIGGAEPLPTMVAHTQGAQRLHTAYSFAFLGERPDAAQVMRHQAPWAQGAGRQAWSSRAFSNHDARGCDALLLAFNLGPSPAAVPLPAGAAPGAAALFVHGGAALHGAQLHLPPGAVMFAPLA